MRCEIGIRCKIRRGALVQPTCGLNHRCTIGENAVIGSRSHIELAAQVGPGVKVPAGSFVPSRSKVLTQSDADALGPAGTAGRATHDPASVIGGTKDENSV